MTAAKEQLNPVHFGPWSFVPGKNDCFQNGWGLLQEIDRAPDDLVQEVLDFLQFVKAKREREQIPPAVEAGSTVEIDTNTTPASSPIEKRDRPIWELFEDAVKDIPDEVLAELPTDGAAQHDHYLYGTPKKTQ